MYVCRYKTPENIEAKLGVNGYVRDPYNLANFFCKNRSNVVEVLSKKIVHILKKA